MIYAVKKMFQDIAPHRYKNEYTPRPPRGGDRLLCFDGDRLLCALDAENRIQLPPCGEQAVQYLFSIDDTGYYLHEGTPLPAQAPYGYVPAKSLRGSFADETRFAAAVGGSLHRWYEQNRFCGCCGAEMEKGTEERSLVCPKCKNTVYPKLCPAVIVAVTDGERLLLTKYAHAPRNNYALVAGFCEIGETVEQTVLREVMEETGLTVTNLRFYKSQPWVYTDSLLMGFFCDAVGSREIRRQESELSEAAWFLRDALPTNHSTDSLTGEMIERFRAGLE